MVEGKLFPNIFIMLLGDPATGKSEALKQTKNFWKYATLSQGGIQHMLHICADNVSKASFLDVLQGSTRVYNPPGGEGYIYSCTCVASSELGAFMSAQDQTFLSTLSDLYDCPPNFVEVKRTTKKENEPISEPTVIAGFATQPQFLGANLPDSSWGQGFMSRVLIVYSEDPTPKKNPFQASSLDNGDLRSQLRWDMGTMLSLHGEMQFSPAARDAYMFIHSQEGKFLQPVPTHPKLAAYIPRREAHFRKLCMISACAAGNTMTIHKEDVLRAREWMLELEVHMEPGMNTIVSSNDFNLVEELAGEIRRICSSGASRIGVNRAYEFLSKRAPAERVPRILELALRSGKVKRGEPEGITLETVSPGS